MDDLSREFVARIDARCNEIRQLYDLSEAEMILVGTLAELVKSMNLSPKLSLKLLKALTAINEMMADEAQALMREGKL